MSTLEQLFGEQAGTLRGLPLSAFRTQEQSRFESLGLPDHKDEEWRFTSLRPLTESPFRLLNTAPASVSPLPASPANADFGCTWSVVFVDGYFAAEQSTMPNKAGVSVKNLVAGEANSAELGSLVADPLLPLAALNGALCSAALQIAVADGQQGGAVLIYHVATAAATDAALHERVWISVGTNASLTVVEYFCGPASRYWRNSVSECSVAEGGRLEHVKLVQEGGAAIHSGSSVFRLQAHAWCNSSSFAFGGRLIRNDLRMQLHGRGAEAGLHGLLIASGNQIIDNHTRIEHCVPDCQSHQLYKAILDQQARGVFNGRIKVHQDAQRTNANQASRNLLLSDDAIIDTNPELEIYADDVRCTHGATVGFLNEEAVFYLRSRGISEPQARSMMTFAFASEVLSLIEDARLHTALLAAINKALPAYALTADAVKEEPYRRGDRCV